MMSLSDRTEYDARFFWELRTGQTVRKPRTRKHRVTASNNENIRGPWSAFVKYAG